MRLSTRTLSSLLTLLLVLAAVASVAAARPRLAVLTDIGGDPDDQQSLIRLMVYANEVRIEALVASAGMHYILAKAPAGRDRREGTYRGMYLTGDESLTSRDWIQRHVASAGPLGTLYPLKTWTSPNKHGCLKEGDTPSWFFFLPLGDNDPADPTRPGWGGQYWRLPDGWYVDLPAMDDFDPRHTVSRWRPDFQRDFARRMAWCLTESDAATPAPR